MFHQAASFGKCFLTDQSPDQFVETCRELRVLNAVREASVGLPLTHAQYPKALGSVRKKRDNIDSSMKRNVGYEFLDF